MGDMIFDTEIEMVPSVCVSTGIVPHGWTSSVNGDFVEFRPVGGAPGEVVLEKDFATGKCYALTPDVPFPALALFTSIRYSKIYELDDVPSGTQVVDPITGRANDNRVFFNETQVVPSWLALPGYGEDGMVAGVDGLLPAVRYEEIPGAVGYETAMVRVPPLVKQQLASGRELLGLPVYRAWDGILKRAPIGDVVGPDNIAMVEDNPGNTAAKRLVASTVWGASNPCVASVYARGSNDISVIGRVGQMSLSWTRFMGSDPPGGTSKAIRSATAGLYSWDYATFESSSSPSAPCSFRWDSSFVISMGKASFLELAFALSGGATGQFRIDPGGYLLQSEHSQIDIGADGNLYSNGELVALTGGKAPFAWQRIGLVFEGDTLKIHDRANGLIGETVFKRSPQMKLLGGVNAHIFGIARARKAPW